MLLLLLLSFAAPLAEAPAPRLVGEFVELKTATGTLYGIIDLPAGRGPWPVVLIHAGSGNTDRDGNSRVSLVDVYRNESLKLLGRGLAANGIAALRIDKRGIGASAKAMVQERDLRVETYADDAAAWVGFLRKDPRFTKVGLIGHSEGTLIGLLAARKARVDAFVSLCGLARPLQDVLRTQLKGKLPKDLEEATAKIMTELEAGREVPKKDVPPLLFALFRPSVQPYLISEFKQDPVESLKKFDGPVLIVSGRNDLQVPVEDGQRLGTAKPGAKHLVLDRMNHVLKSTDSTTIAGQLSLYREPGVPLHPKLIPEVVGFLESSLGGK